MRSRRVRGTLVAGLALGLASVPIASTAFAASSTKGLVSLRLQGVGTGGLGNGACSGIPCKAADTCSCLGAAYALKGAGIGEGGKLTVALTVDTTNDDFLPIDDLGESCNPGTGTGTISSKNGSETITVNISGLECPTLGSADVFAGTYVVTGGSGGFSSSSGGTGAINGSQIPTTGSLGQVAITGTLQAIAP